MASIFECMKSRAHCNFFRSLISKAKSNFLTNLVTESFSNGNPRTIWKTLNSILHCNPSYSSSDKLDTLSLTGTNSFQSFILYSRKHFFLMTISSTFNLFLTWTSSPKFLNMWLLLISSLTYYLTPFLVFHFTEITLLSIHNSLILAIDCGEATSLILLDFLFFCCLDAVDHTILEPSILHHLQN